MLTPNKTTPPTKKNSPEGHVSVRGLKARVTAPRDLTVQLVPLHVLKARVSYGLFGAVSLAFTTMLVPMAIEAGTAPLWIAVGGFAAFTAASSALTIWTPGLKV